MKNRFIRAAVILCAMFILLCSCQTTQCAPGRSGAAKLVIGCDIYAPYFYIGEDGDFCGSDVEIAEEACRRLGIELETVQIPWQDKEEYLENGIIDCIWGCFSMNGREDQFAWAGPYAYSYQSVMVNADSDIYTLSDLDGKTVAVHNMSKPEELFLSEKVPENGSVRRVYAFTNIDNAVAALKKQYVDACAGHEVAYRMFADRNEGAFRFLDEKLLRSDLGVAFYNDENGRETAKMVDAVLDEMLKDGTVAKILEANGISADELPEG